MKKQVKVARRLNKQEQIEVHRLRSELMKDGYDFPKYVEDIQVYRVDGEIGIGPGEGTVVRTAIDSLDLDDSDVNYIY